MNNQDKAKYYQLKEICTKLTYRDIYTSFFQISKRGSYLLKFMQLTGLEDPVRIEYRTLDDITPEELMRQYWIFNSVRVNNEKRRNRLSLANPLFIDNVIQLKAK